MPCLSRRISKIGVSSLCFRPIGKHLGKERISVDFRSLFKATLFNSPPEAENFSKYASLSITSRFCKLTRTCRARQGAPKDFARTELHSITTGNNFPVSAIGDFRQFSYRRWPKLRICIRFDEYQKDSLILSCLIPSDHPTNFAYPPPHFKFLHGGERLGFSAIPVVVVVVVIYLSIYLCSGIL